MAGMGCLQHCLANGHHRRRAPALYWWVAGVPIHWRLLQLRRWRHLISDSGLLLVATFFYTVVGQGDYFMLGILHSETVVGIYYFAFNLSTQTLLMLSYNLGTDYVSRVGVKSSRIPSGRCRR